MYPAGSGVPQGSIVGPYINNLYTSDLPINENTLTATYLGKTVILVEGDYPLTASLNTQEHFNEIKR